MNKFPLLDTENIQQFTPLTPLGCTAVLVTNQFECERLIRAGRAVADISRTELCIINVENNDYPTNPDAIQYLFNVSAENGAVMHLMYSDNTFKTICKYFKENKTSAVVTGMPSSPGSILYKMWEKFPCINFFTVNRDGKVESVSARSASHETIASSKSNG